MLTLFLPLAQVEVWLPGVVLLGFCVGVLTGLFGVGGGFLLTPALKALFGVPYPIAVGTDLVQIFLTGSVSAYRHQRAGNVELRLGLVLGVGAVAGAEVGLRIQNALESIGEVSVSGSGITLLDLVLGGLFVVLLASVAVLVWRETRSGRGDGVDTRVARALRRIRLRPLIALPRSDLAGISVWVPLTMGFGVGILTGLMGVGGGFINFPLLIYVLGVPTHVAIGTSAVQVLLASGYGALRHAGQRHVELPLVLLLTAGSVLGVQVGVRMVKRFKGVRIRRLFAAVLLLGIATIVWDVSRQLLAR